MFLLLVSGLLGCQGTEIPEPEASATLKLYVFDCGRLKLDSLEFFSIADDETDIRELAVPCYVIEHERGRLLWDGGLPSRIAETEGWQGEGIYMRLDRTLPEQLADIGLNMSSFDYMAFSHMHFDHCGVANDIQEAMLLIQKAEAEFAFAEGMSHAGFDPSVYAGLRDAEQIPLEGDHDVFGDGRVRIISAPGHTPGHQVLYLELENTGPIVLSGDLYHFALSREQQRVPTFNFDVDMTLASMKRVESFLEEAGATLWIEHELALFQRLNKSPSHYD
jgi:glyoxylase-like metal-dependent hydrolase (beta-lactamase superfamily II)